MSYRSTASFGLLVATLAVSPLALASSDGFRALNNEAGFEFVGAASAVSRAEVTRQMQAAQRDGTWQLTEASPAPTPSTTRMGFASTREQARQAEALRDRATASNGWRDAGGEAGWVFEGR